MLVVLSEASQAKLADLKKENDAFQNAKAGITRVQREYQEFSRSKHPDAALQMLIDFADRRIAATSYEMLRIQTLGK